jgi:hypothetical protein
MSPWVRVVDPATPWDPGGLEAYQTPRNTHGVALFIGSGRYLDVDLSTCLQHEYRPERRVYYTSYGTWVWRP